MTSIRTRLLAGTALGVALTFAIGGVLVYALTRSQMYAQFDDGLATRARALTALIEQEGTKIETDLGREETTFEFHELWHSGGPGATSIVLRRSKSLGTKDLAVFPTGPSTVTIEAVVLPDGRVGRQATLAFHPHQDLDDGPPSPPVTLTFALARDTAEVDATIAALARVLLLVGFAATLLAVALLAAAVRFGLRPIRELASAIAELRESNLAARLDTAQSPAELRPVVDRLNDLLRRLESAFARERELTAEVAHELRTPMAGLRATIEVALDRERTPERYRTALADCLAICVQTERTVESLLSLARLDAGMVAVDKAPVELDELVRESLATRVARAGERQLVVETELARVTSETDRDKLRVVLDNLLDNAVSYANTGGTVRVEIARDSRVRITVSNTGCTLPADQAAQVFERFWRGDKARSGSHAGIGLALSKKLIDLLGGSIRAEVAGDRFVAIVVL